MEKALFDDFKKEDLIKFVKKLQTEHYDVSDALCASAKKQAALLRDLEKNSASSQYLSICTGLIEEIQNYIKHRKETLIPYLLELFEKNAENHDCSNCNGNSTCGVKHKMQFTELTTTHDYIKTVLDRLQMVALPLYSDTLYPDLYRVLRNNMALLESSLSKLFYIEGVSLIPKVAEAQKNINVQ